ncbi:MAG: class I SAM-dependent methyltransferase [Aureliella sp.]
MTKSIPSWQLPPGVSRGTWDYISSAAIAEQYDAYVADNPLLELDQRLTLDLVAELQQIRSTQEIVVADLGCGTGRIAQAVLPTGCRMMNVDLSKSMLSVLQGKIPVEYQEKNECVHASLVDVGQAIPASSVDLAVCLFSSLGMIRGREFRRRCLAGVYSCLKPGGKFLLHAHNRYLSLFDPGGLSWLARTRVSSLVGQDVEFGDRVYAYRNLPKMFLHIYSHRELLQDLRAAGFDHTSIRGVKATGEQLMLRRLGWTLRAGGFFATAEKSYS